MHTVLSQKKPLFDAAIDHLHKEFGALRTGRATPALVEDIPVNAYDAIMEIKGLASIQTQDAKTLVIDPWDKGLIRNIEKAIRDAGVGLSPVVDGTVIRIMMPPMTEDNRKAMVKKMKEFLEDARIRCRQVREEARELSLKMEKDKEISEDEKFKLFDEIDKMTKEYTDLIEQAGNNKEDEIMTI
ncbi:ribosome recycling factor [Candidatus Uhrbacteria bacterium]|nr:ribosome recycling factor [Candidatus Uhrbacteria bacterium]